MIRINDIRDYEVSLWTLQDSFITVLKQFGLDNKEKIQEPLMILKDDGENTFSFKIPMYILDNNGEFKENPIWYTSRNGNLIVNLRKVKVIFNKKMASEKVFEFIINNVVEEHEGYSKYCQVSCDGLAFHELGKQGYNITLSEEVYLAELNNWNETDGNQGTKPFNNIDYWIKKVLNNSNWTYEIRMDWSFAPSGRLSNKVYDEPYVAAWTEQNNKIVAQSIVTDNGELEKKAFVDGKESNRYNLLMKIAEAFEVFCKFEYSYDSNYHIIGRKVIFYNNFINEFDGMIDFTYGYNTGHITREMDSNDLVSKMFIKNLTDSGTLSGQVGLDNTSLNKTGENYLLNFDYLYKIGTISQEQYDSVKEFEDNLYKINKEISQRNELILKYVNQNPRLEAALKTAEDLKKEAEERIATAKGLYESEASISSFPTNNPKIFPIISDTEVANGYYINIPVDIRDIKGKIQLYKTRSSTNFEVSNEIVSSSITKIDYDEVTHFITRIYLTLPNFSENQIYGVFTYDPQGVSKKIQEIYNIAKENAETDITDLSTKLYGNKATIKTKTIVETVPLYYLKNNTTAPSKPNSTITNNSDSSINNWSKKIPIYSDGYTYFYCEEVHWSNDTKTWTNVISLNDIDNNNSNAVAAVGYTGFINFLEAVQEKKNEQKQKIIATFEKLMGPSLREGFWQPDDIYSKYYNFKTVSISNIMNASNNSYFIWDTELFENEQKLTYKSGNQTKYYAAINLSNNTSLQNLIMNNENNDVFFMYRDNTWDENVSTTDVRANKYLALGTDDGCKIAFLKPKTSGAVIPVLLITLKTNDDLKRNARVCRISYNGNTTVESGATEGSAAISISPDSWLNTNNYNIVYPRFYIDYHNFIETQPESKIIQGSTALEENKDYYQLYRNGNYYITIKNESLLRNLSTSTAYKFNYCLSTAADAMYIDAIKILKENSVPKVSYTMEPLALDTNFIHNAYDRLGQLIHVNDIELKFQNVQGYISEVDLNLDKPWEDTYVIKNYKTKFEDLFSTIVAQTEAMQKNSQLLNMMTNAFDANGALKDDITQGILDQVRLVHVPTPTEIYAQYEPQIRAELRQAFEDAGEVLAAAQSSVADVNALNIANASILGSFVEDIKANMTPATFRYFPRESDKFKVGDIWYFTKNGISYEYLATENSSQVDYTGENSKLESLRGWSLTKDGSLAQIKGAALNIDAQNEIIELKAGKTINLKSGQNASIQANDNILIQANNIVDITGSQINIGSVSSSDDKGIKIVSSTASNAGSATSYVDIKPSGIKMITAGGISMAGAGGIKIYTSNSAVSGTTAISLDSTNGVYIGSGKAVNIYSGDIQVSGTTITTPGTGSSVLISPTKILFGIVNQTTNEGTAIEMTANRFIIGAANIVKGTNETNKNNIGVSSTTALNNTNNNTGVYITREVLRLATGTGTSRSYIGMDENGVTIAKATSSSNGAIIKIGKVDNSDHYGILIGTATNKDTYVDEIKSDTHTLISNYDGGRFQVYAPNFVVDAEGKLYAYDAYIAGTVYASAGSFTGNVTATSLTIRKNNTNTDIQNYIENFGYITTNDVNDHFLNNTDFVVDGDLGLIRGTAYKTTKQGHLISGTQLELEGNGYLALTSITEGNKIAKIEIDNNGWIILSSTKAGSPINTTSSVKIGSNKISISSTGTFDVTSENFNVNSSASGPTIVFSVGNTSTSGLSYSASGGLTVKGKITATSGTFTGTVEASSGSLGGWTITSNGLYSPIDDTLGSNTPRTHITTNTSYTNAISVGAIDSDSNGTWNWNSAPFRVNHDGKLYATNAEITGIIKATSGNIGTWYIGNWTVNSTNLGYIGNGSTRAKSTVGICPATTEDYVAIWAGANGSSVSSAPFKVRGDGKLIATDAEISGVIYATEFRLAPGEKISADYIDGLNIDNLEIQDFNNSDIYYQLSSSGQQTPTGTWSTTVPNPPNNTSSKRYLWTKTIFHFGSNNNKNVTSYSVSYYGTDGSNGSPGQNGKYITSVTPLFYLKTNNTNPTDPPTSIKSTDIKNSWTTIIPTYSGSGTYYRSEKQTWSDGSTTYTNVYEDYGLTYSASTATAASIAADDASSATTPIIANGLSSGTWNGIDYGLILGNKSTSKPMLIGSNSGITIAKTATASNGAAMVIDNSGIAFKATTVSLRTSGDVVSLNGNGITIGTSGTLTIGSNNFVVTNTTNSGDVAFRIGTSANPYLTYVVDTGLSIKGEISATSGYIGSSSNGWSISSSALTAKKETSIIRLGISNTTYDGGFCGKYFYLYKNKTADTGYLDKRYFLINPDAVKVTTSDNTIIAETTINNTTTSQRGVSIQNMPFNWDYNSTDFDNSIIHVPEIRFGSVTTYLRYKQTNLSGSTTKIDNYIYLHANDSDDLRMISSKNSIRFSAPNGTISLGGADQTLRILGKKVSTAVIGNNTVLVLTDTIT